MGEQERVRCPARGYSQLSACCQATLLSAQRQVQKGRKVRAVNQHGVP